MWMLLLFVFTNLLFSNHDFKASKSDCGISEIYEAIDADYGVKVLIGYGHLEDAELILVPYKMDVGTYKVSVTRKATNLYKVDGTKIYIETSYCYEYSYMVDAILDITGNYGYKKGTLYLK